MLNNWIGYIFVDVDENLLHDIHDLGHGLTLRKATVEEINETLILSNYENWNMRRGEIFIPQQTISKPSETNENAIETEKLSNPSEWRFTVIDSNNSKLKFFHLNIIFSISINADLRMGLIKIGESYSQPYLDFLMLDVDNPLIPKIGRPTLVSLSNLHVLRKNINAFVECIENQKMTDEIWEILHLFNSLDNVPNYSIIKILGYFSVIEGLLSHAPNGSDRMDSIQKQLIRNITLLNNRLKNTGDQISFEIFGNTKIDTILKKLYAFRSSIAHGASLKKSLSDLNNLLDKKKDEYLWIHDFLRDMTKKLLLAAIREPQLITDLK